MSSLAVPVATLSLALGDSAGSTYLNRNIKAYIGCKDDSSDESREYSSLTSSPLTPSSDKRAVNLH